MHLVYTSVKCQTQKVMVSLGDPASGVQHQALGSCWCPGCGLTWDCGAWDSLVGCPAWAPSYPGTFRELISVGWWWRRQREPVAPKSRSPLPTPAPAGRRCGSPPAPLLARALCSSNNLIRFPRPPIEMRLTSACTRACGPSEAIPDPDPDPDPGEQGPAPAPPRPFLQPGQYAEGGREGAIPERRCLESPGRGV